MKKIILLILLPICSYAQEKEHSKFEIQPQVSYLRGIYKGGGIEEFNFFQNYYFQLEVNYSVNNWLQTGGYIAYARGDSRLPYSWNSNIQGFRRLTSNILFLGSNINVFYCNILRENTFFIKPYLTFEYGYLLFDNPDPDAIPVPKNGFTFVPGTGLKIRLKKNRALLTELVYNQKLLLRAGLSFNL